MEAQRGSSGIALLFNLGARWGWVVNATPWTLYPGERNAVPIVQEGGWAGPRSSLDGCGKPRSHQGSDPRNVQPVASRYTDCTIPAHVCSRQK